MYEILIINSISSILYDAVEYVENELSTDYKILVANNYSGIIDEHFIKLNENSFFDFKDYNLYKSKKVIVLSNKDLAGFENLIVLAGKLSENVEVFTPEKDVIEIDKAEISKINDKFKKLKLIKVLLYPFVFTSLLTIILVSFFVDILTLNNNLFLKKTDI